MLSVVSRAVLPHGDLWVLAASTSRSSRRKRLCLEVFMDNELDLEQENEYIPEIYTLEDDEGNEHTFELVDVLEVEGCRYYAMIPYTEEGELDIPPADLSAEDDVDELVILKSDPTDPEEMLASIDDDEEYERIGQLFMDRLAMEDDTDILYDVDLPE